MNIETLKFFKKVADVKSISKVSVESHISQSALSQMIQKLEDSIGYQLFIRSNKGVELTKIGQIVYEYTETILKTYKKMTDDLILAEQNQFKITINSTWAISDYCLPGLLVEMKKKYPLINYELHSNRSEDIITNVEHGIADIGVIYSDYASDVLDFHHFTDEKIVLVATKDFNIPSKITIEELYKYKIIYFKNGCYNTEINETVAKLTNQINAKFEPILNLDSISAVKTSTMQGFGIAFVPYSAVKKELQEKKLKIVEVEKMNIVLKVNAISLKYHKLNNHVKKIIDFIIKYGAKVLG